MLEGYHNALREHYECAHPNIWIFIRKLADLQVKIDVDIRLLEENGTVKKRKTDNYDRQVNLCIRYKDFENLEFIKEIAKTL